MNALSQPTSEAEPGSTHNLNDLFVAHYERVTRVVGRVIHDQARAEEIAVEVFLKWIKNSRAHGSGAEGWLYRTAVHEALDELRRHNRRMRFEKLFAPFLLAPSTPAQVYEIKSERKHVRAVLAVLKPQTAGILIFWAEDLSYREIAAALKINPNYVGSLLSRAQEAFRKEYSKRYGTELDQ